MNNSVFETILGACVLAVAGFFLYTGYCDNGSSLSQGYILKARFDKIDGISVGSDVSIAGVKIGSVQSIYLDKKTFQPIISFIINPSINVPDDSSAEIISDGFLGGKHINISPGGSVENLVEGDIIDNTQPSVSLEQLLSKFLFSSPSSNSPSSSSLPAVSQPVLSSDEKKAD